MNKNDWADNLPVAITVCDLEGTITYMNDKSRVTFIRDNEDDLVGKNLKDCHSPESNTKIFQLINTQQSNFYTIEKNGKKKMIAQVPWYLGNEVAGLVEFSFEIPLELPHFIRGQMIYHIANLDEFSNSKVRSTYFPAAFLQDGFIHCSTREQVIPVANRWFLNSTNMVLLEIDEDKLGNDVVYENLEGGLELYPHVYGEIPYPAIFRFAFLQPGTGGFSFPSEWITVDH